MIYYSPKEAKYVYVQYTEFEDLQQHLNNFRAKNFCLHMVCSLH